MEAKKCGWCGSEPTRWPDGVECNGERCLLATHLTTMPTIDWNALMDRLDRVSALESALGPFADAADLARVGQVYVPVHVDWLKAARSALEAGK